MHSVCCRNGNDHEDYNDHVVDDVDDGDAGDGDHDDDEDNAGDDLTLSFREIQCFQCYMMPTSPTILPCQSMKTK